MDSLEQLPELDVIQAAVEGEKWAIDKVVAHYEDYINEQSTEDVRQPDGSTKRVLNEELKRRLTEKLIQEIPNFPMPQG